MHASLFAMNAQPLLSLVAQALQEENLEAILIGNAAAALQGSPVTTLDFDFYFRKTSTNLQKLKSVADRLNATIYKPFYPASGLYRVQREQDGLQLDFMSQIHGVKSFASLRSRSSTVNFDGYELKVASLADIIKSKRAAGRPQDLAVLEILEKTLSEKKLIEKGNEKKQKNRTK